MRAGIVRFLFVFVVLLTAAATASPAMALTDPFKKDINELSSGEIEDGKALSDAWQKAVVAWKTENYEGAEDLWSDCYELAVETLGKDHDVARVALIWHRRCERALTWDEEEIDAFNNRWFSLSDRVSIGETNEEIYKQRVLARLEALKEMPELLGKDSCDMAFVHLSAAVTLHTFGVYGTAIKQVDKAISIYEKHLSGNNLSYAGALDFRAAIHHARGSFEAARADASRAAAIWRKANLPDLDKLSENPYDKNLRHVQSHLKLEGLTDAERVARDHHNQLVAETKKSVVIFYHATRVANLFSNAQAYERAKKWAEEAEPLRQAGPQRGKLMTHLAVIDGKIALHQKDFDKAAIEFSKLTQEEGIMKGAGHAFLALTSNLQNDRDRTGKQIAKTLELHRALRESEPLGTRDTFSELVCRTLLQTGCNAKCIELGKDVVKELKEATSEGTASADILLHMAHASQNLDKPAQARDYFEKVIAFLTQRNHKTSGALLSPLRQYASVLKSQGEKEKLAEVENRIAVIEAAVQSATAK